MTLPVALAIFAAGLFFSAFFSGAETGFYRVNRVRLLLEARTGGRIAGMLLWLTNHPTLFVGSTLVGNNLANYLTSFAIIAAVSRIGLESQWGELAATIAFSPIVFVYGELLPKSLFFRAPNRLLPLSGPLMLISVVLFSPIAGFLWGLGWLIQLWLGETPLQFQQSVARHELLRMLREGHDAGLLKSSQQQLSRNLFRLASRSVAGFTAPPHRIAAIDLHEQRERALEIAQRRSLNAMPVRAGEAGQWIGYVRVVDLHLGGLETVEHVRPLPQVQAADSYLETLMHLQEQGEEIALVTNEDGAPVGLVYANDLREPLFRSLS